MSRSTEYGDSPRLAVWAIKSSIGLALALLLSTGVALLSRAPITGLPVDPVLVHIVAMACFAVAVGMKVQGEVEHRYGLNPLDWAFDLSLHLSWYMVWSATHGRWFVAVPMLIVLLTCWPWSEE